MLDEFEGHARFRSTVTRTVRPSTPDAPRPPPLGSPARTAELEPELLRHEAISKVPNDQGITDANVEILPAVIYRHHVRVADPWRVAIFLAGDAAHAMPRRSGRVSRPASAMRPMCWKLAAVAKDHAPSGCSTATKPTQTTRHRLTRRACRTGRIITNAYTGCAVVRSRLLRAPFLQVPAADAGLRLSRLGYRGTGWPKGLHVSRTPPSISLSSFRDHR